VLKINSHITVELGNGQKITMSLEEGKELINGLSKFIEDGMHMPNEKRMRKEALRIYTGRRRKIPGMSEPKKEEIIKHVNKKLSSKPRTLSNLLNGVSYIPNHLPMIRQFIENEPHISKKIIGRRTYYSLKEADSERLARPPKIAATV
jgi:hypothetical protein